MSDPPTADDAPTYDPGEGAAGRLERLAKLLRLGQAPPFALVVLSPSDVLVDLEADRAPDAQDILLALTVAVGQMQADADAWAMVTEMSEASEPQEEPP